MFRCFTSYRGMLILAGSVVVGGYLVVWHGSHVAAALPLLVILACPLAHMFMHSGHGHHHRHGDNAEPPPASGSSSRQSTDKGE